MILKSEYGELADKRSRTLKTKYALSAQLQKIDEQIKRSRFEALDFAVSVINIHSSRLPVFFKGRFNLDSIVDGLILGIEKDEVLAHRREQYDTFCHALNMINPRVFNAFTKFFVVNEVENKIQRIKEAALKTERESDKLLEPHRFVTRTQTSEDEFHKVVYEVDSLEQMLITLSRELQELLESAKYEQQLEDRISSFKRRTRRGFFLVPLPATV